MMAGGMKDRSGGVAYWALHILIALLLAIAYIWIMAWWLLPPPERDDAPTPIRISATDKRWIQQRHKYHGIPGSIEDEAGNKYFYRDGQKCKL